MGESSVRNQSGGGVEPNDPMAPLAQITNHSTFAATDLEYLIRGHW